jgi:hypothetical protein
MGLRVSDVINEEIKVLEKKYKTYLQNVSIHDLGHSLEGVQLRNQIKALKNLRTKLRRKKLI